ncbi:MAG TPA: replication initiation protein RepC [Rhodobacterales bacterium]|nr:replication initiation protein RepC [Rhodobacterales bacterium]
MEVLTTTPFGRRPVTAALIKQAQAAQAPASTPHFNKWELFRELCVARAAYGVSDRDLTVLNALLSFHREANLSDNDSLIVFPSNRALAERAHGMAESTLRRHLAALVGAGLIARHDSPNGKRYAARAADGSIARAFGLDLRPLLVRAQEITHAAAEARAAAERLRRAREEVVLMKRDLLKLIEYGRETRPQAPWEDAEADALRIHKQMRRKMDMTTLEALAADLRQSLARVRDTLSETEKMSGNASENERHYTNSNTDSHDLELTQEKGKAAAVEPNLPLALVLKACPDILPYAPDRPKHWHELVALAGFVRGMMGISPDAWRAAQRVMGPEVAAITLAGILQRISEIKSPGGYLRALTRKAESGAFSPGPMIMALLRVEA